MQQSSPRGTISALTLGVIGGAIQERQDALAELWRLADAAVGP